MLRMQARNPEVLGVGQEVGVWQKPVSGCPLPDTECNCICAHPKHPQLCSRRPGILPASGSPSLPSLFLHPPPQIPPDWPSKPFPRQGALKDSSVVGGSQKCQAGDSGSDQQAASPQPDPPLSWLTDPQQLWPLPPGAGGWGLTDWRVSSLEAAGEGGHARQELQIVPTHFSNLLKQG